MQMGKGIGTIELKAMLRPAILRTFVKSRPDSRGVCKSDIVDEKVLVHMLGGIDDEGMYTVEYEDGTLSKARYDRIAFTDSLHDTYDFE